MEEVQQDLTNENLNHSALICKILQKNWYRNKNVTGVTVHLVPESEHTTAKTATTTTTTTKQLTVYFLPESEGGGKRKKNLAPGAAAFQNC